MLVWGFINHVRKDVAILIINQHEVNSLEVYQFYLAWDATVGVRVGNQQYFTKKLGQQFFEACKDKGRNPIIVSYWSQSEEKLLIFTLKLDFCGKLENIKPHCWNQVFLNTAKYDKTNSVLAVNFPKIQDKEEKEEDAEEKEEDSDKPVCLFLSSLQWENLYGGFTN